MNDIERIVCACVKAKDGKFVLCKRHWEGIRLKAQLRGEKTTTRQQWFRTNKERFVWRWTAFKIAKAAGQLRVMDWITWEVICRKDRFEEKEPVLYSEDIY